jgi:short-subunit dehydrogenase
MRRVAVVTGASSGIGLELARVLARENHDLVLVARSEDKLQELKIEIQKTKDTKIEIVPLDLSDADASQDLYDRVARLGWPIEVLINNAGFGAYGRFADINWKRQSEMIGLNVTSLAHLCHLFLPQMVSRRSGRIMNVASTAAFQAGPFMATYFATKAFVLSFSEAIATELEGTGVTVTALCPGPTRSNFGTAANMGRSKLFSGGASRIPTSAEVAEYGFRAMQRGETVAVHGTLNNVLVTGTRLMPRAVIRKITARMVGAPHTS